MSGPICVAGDWLALTNRSAHTHAGQNALRRPRTPQAHSLTPGSAPFADSNCAYTTSAARIQELGLEGLATGRRAEGKLYRLIRDTCDWGPRHRIPLGPRDAAGAPREAPSSHKDQMDVTADLTGHHRGLEPRQVHPGMDEFL